MVVVPATPREVSTRKLNTVRVANTVLRRAIGDLQADEGAEGGRRQAKVSGDDFGEFGRGDGMFERRPSSDPLRAEAIAGQPRVANWAIRQVQQSTIQRFRSSIFELLSEATLQVVTGGVDAGDIRGERASRGQGAGISKVSLPELVPRRNQSIFKR